MSINKYIVSKDNDIYEAWPDLILTNSGKLICIFCECTHHGNRAYSRIVTCESLDKGKTWSRKKAFTQPISADGSIYWDCPRISKLKDGRLVVLCDKILNKKQTAGEIYIWIGDKDGEIWSEPVNTKIEGIVPDKLLESSNRWIISAHLGDVDGFSKLQQRLWYSDDQGNTWNGPIVVGKDETLNLCEGSILQVKNKQLVCFMRENSSLGYECYVSKSLDNGETWSELYTIPLACCHRPVSGFLDTGEIMITYRYRQGAQRGWLGAWTQNTFVAITDIETVLTSDRKDQYVRIMPLNYDPSPESDLGYTGWVQFDDGVIYIVDYIKNKEKNSYIIGCSFDRDQIGGRRIEK